jgi:hypothetical protein
MRPASSPTLAIDRRINPYEYRCKEALLREWITIEEVTQPDSG